MDDFNEINIADTQEKTDKKCPQCGGVMDFDPASGRLKCPYCEYEETIKQEEQQPVKAQEMDFYEAEHTANKDWGVDTKTVICKACGAESIYDALQTSAVCPFCGSNQVMDANEQDTIAPGGVVPFSISDKQASDLFHKWIKKKWFCPKLAKDSAKPKRFKGIYLPYWTFDSQTFSSYRGEYGIDHKKKDRNGNTHIETEWHHTSGTYKEFIDDELVLASKNHDMSMLRRIEPFDTENNKTYKPEYIAGFVAERYSIGLKDAWGRAMQSIKTKLKRHVSDKIEREHHADRTRNVSLSTQFNDITYKYLLLPIWISNFKYNDKVYQFMVNGQTGKVAGKTPISVPKVVITIIAIIAIIALLYYLGVWG
ncbi:MAG: hypothetical protein K2K56_01420 [Lachnospiraceae bacterium]|nr:hypothetical protein [Lachnospiraceae bacterium]